MILNAFPKRDRWSQHKGLVLEIPNGMEGTLRSLNPCSHNPVEHQYSNSV